MEKTKIGLKEFLAFTYFFVIIQFCLYHFKINFANPRVFAYSLLLSAIMPLLISDVLSRMRKRGHKIFSLRLKNEDIKIFKESNVLKLNEEKRKIFKEKIGSEFPEEGVVATPIANTKNKWEIVVQKEKNILKIKANRLSIYQKKKRTENEL